MNVVVKPPQLSIAGTPFDHLHEAHAAAATAIWAALKAHDETAPHPRDYSPEDYVVARNDHERRIAALYTAFKEVEAILESIVEQKDARDAQRRNR